MQFHLNLLLVRLNSQHPAPSRPPTPNRPLDLPRRINRRMQLIRTRSRRRRRRFIARQHDQLRHFSPVTHPIDPVPVRLRRQRLEPRRAPRQIEILELVQPLAQPAQQEHRLGPVVVQRVAV